ncbi:hypothetical protein V8E36_000585, partial [Tilletia maclaganii]
MARLPAFDSLPFSSEKPSCFSRRNHRTDPSLLTFPIPSFSFSLLLLELLFLPHPQFCLSLPCPVGCPLPPFSSPRKAWTGSLPPRPSLWPTPPRRMTTLSTTILMSLQILRRQGSHPLPELSSPTRLTTTFWPRTRLMPTRPWPRLSLPDPSLLPLSRRFCLRTPASTLRTLVLAPARSRTSIPTPTMAKLGKTKTRPPPFLRPVTRSARLPPLRLRTRTMWAPLRLRKRHWLNSPQSIRPAMLPCLNTVLPS